MLIRIFAALLILFFVFTNICVADFMVSDNPTFDVSAGWSKNSLRLDIQTVLPIKDGYAGVEWVKESGYEYLNSRLEQRYRIGQIGIAGYGRYNKSSLMLHEHLIGVGANIELYLYEKHDNNVHVGIGTWASSEKLLKEYDSGTGGTVEGVDFGPRAHIAINLKKFSLLTEGLFNPDGKNYTIRFLPHLELPIVKLFFIEQISLVFSARVEYFSETKHPEIDDFHWSWKHSWRLPF